MRKFRNWCSGLVCAAACAGLASAAPHHSVHIVAPKDDSTVHDNSGNVAVQVSVSPALDAAAGDRIVLLLDGKPVQEASDKHMELHGVDRGTHHLKAQLTAADGAILAASPTTSFHMWRASRR